MSGASARCAPFRPACCRKIRPARGPAGRAGPGRAGPPRRGRRPALDSKGLVSKNFDYSRIQFFKDSLFKESNLARFQGFNFQGLRFQGFEFPSPRHRTPATASAGPGGVRSRSPVGTGPTGRRPATQRRPAGPSSEPHVRALARRTPVTGAAPDRRDQIDCLRYLKEHCLRPPRPRQVRSALVPVNPASFGLAFRRRTSQSPRGIPGSTRPC